MSLTWRIALYVIAAIGIVALVAHNISSAT